MGASLCTQRRQPGVDQIDTIFRKSTGSPLQETKELSSNSRVCPSNQGLGGSSYSYEEPTRGCIQQTRASPGVKRLSAKFLRKKRRQQFTTYQLKSIWQLYYPGRQEITRTEFCVLTKDIVKCLQEMWKEEMIDRVTQRPGNVMIDCDKYHITMTSEGIHRYWHSGQWLSTTPRGILTEKIFLMDLNQASQKILSKIVTQIEMNPDGYIDFEFFISCFPKAFNMAIIRREDLSLTDSDIPIQFEEIDLPQPGHDHQESDQEDSYENHHCHLKEDHRTEFPG